MQAITDFNNITPNKLTQFPASSYGMECNLTDSVMKTGTKPIMTFRDLSKSFDGRKVLDSVSGEIRCGEVILLRGNNGSGKTTLVNILTGCLAPDAGKISICNERHSESFSFPRSWWRSINPWQHFTPERMAQSGTSRVWQDIRLFSSLPLVENIAVASRELAETPWSAIWRTRRSSRLLSSIRADALRRLELLGLSDRESSSGDRVSLGQSKRVAIARSLQAHGRVLMMDEPLSGLDKAGIDTVLETLWKTVRKFRMALVIIEHSLNAHYLRPLVNTVWELSDGRITSFLSLIHI